MLFSDTTPDPLAQWPAILQALAVLISAIFSGVAALYAVMAKLASEKAQTAVVKIKEDVADVKSDVQTIEKATNSMKDALVKATGEASFAAGEKVGLATRKEESVTHTLTAHTHPSPTGTIDVEIEGTMKATPSKQPDTKRGAK